MRGIRGGSGGFLVAIVMLTGLIAAPLPVRAATVTVTTGNDSGPGSLRQAIAPAVTTVTLTSDTLMLTKSVTITGSASGTVTIARSTMSGSLNFGVLDVSSGVTDAILARLTLTRGYAVGGDGGGVRNSGTLVVRDSTITGNTAGASANGGGIANSGTLTVVNSTISGNTAGRNGGGISNSGTATITNSTIIGNTAYFSGGGIDNGGAATITSSTITANHAYSSNGSGIRITGGTVNLRGSIVAGNTPTTAANISGTLTVSTNNLTSGDPQLAPLGDYGGPTQTMPPLPGSPARDAAGATCPTDPATGTPLTRGQRGQVRPRGACDIGAVEVQPSIRVLSTGDDGSSSLRDALLAVETGSTISFLLPFQSPTITLTSGALTIARNVTLTGETAGPVIARSAANGTPPFRIFTVNSGVTARISGLTITGGSSSSGGGIYNRGTLTVRESTIADNTAGNGGGIYNSGGNLTLVNSTITENNGGGSGGGIYNDDTGSTLTVTSSTISGNAAAVRNGGIFVATGSTASVRGSIVAGNTAPTNPNIGGTLTVNTNNLTAGDPLLLPLGTYGPGGRTMPSRADSPALDGGAAACPNDPATGTPLAYDAYTFPRPKGAACDIGAVEVQTTTPTLQPAQAGTTGDQDVTLVGTGFQRNTTVTVNGQITPVRSLAPDGTRLTMRVAGQPMGMSVPLVATNPGTAGRGPTTLTFVTPAAAPTDTRPAAPNPQLPTSAPPNVRVPAPPASAPTPLLAPMRR